MKIKIVAKRNYPELKMLRDNFTISKKCDICIAVGGDGTFVRAAQSTDAPILLVRSYEEGSIGYYSDVGLKDMQFVVNKLKEHKFYIEKLGNKIELIFKKGRYYAVNEARMNNILEEVSFRIYEVNGKRISKIYPYIMSGDGLIVTGQIGSTAYNKSAEGPIILSPNVLCITFLNPDGPFRNPLVIDSSKELEVEVVKYHGQLRYDGTDIGRISPKQRFRIKFSHKELRVVRFREKKEEFADKLERIIKSRMLKEFRSNNNSRER